MQTIRGTKDILPSEITTWQKLYFEALNTLNLYNYHEIRTPIIENTDVFLKSVGDSTDIINKEMYRFIDQGERDITLRPEGTASIARAIASNKLYTTQALHKLWYMGPMFRYERPQNGRQRQFHQLGVECIGTDSPLADVEVIQIAYSLLKKFNCHNYNIELNSLGTKEERGKYQVAFKKFLKKYENDLDDDSKKRLYTNPLRILDSKNIKVQELIKEAPSINQYLEKDSRAHFEFICEYLSLLNIPYEINTKLVRGLDYYTHTAFEITSNELGSQKTICGGGRYSKLVKQFGGPDLPGVGWAIGIERLLILIKNNYNTEYSNNRFDIITEGLEAQRISCNLIQLLEEENIMFNLNFSNQSLNKQIKKSIQNKSLGCLILGTHEINNSTITIKWLQERYQETIEYSNIINYLNIKLDKHIKRT